MSILEKDVEAKVVRYAKQHGFLVRKMNGTGARSWPDRLFVSPRGYHSYIEFKAPGKWVEKGSAQELFLQELKERGVNVYVINDAAKGCAVIDAELTR